MSSASRAAGSVLTVVGARPQFVKAATVSRALREAGIREALVHTGQHYDWEMSQAFFEGLDLPRPEVNLEVGSGRHGRQTGRMLEKLEEVIIDRSPDLVMVYGDTNSTVAGALAAAKLHVPLAHVESGLRSFNRRMPEEINRVVTDHVSAILFAPTDRAVENLAAEGITSGVVRTGDVMCDLALETAPRLDHLAADVLPRLGLDRGEYAFVTIHRAENTDDPARWRGIVDGIARIAAEGVAVVWPAHPRTKELVRGLAAERLHVLPPLPYLETQVLIRFARVVITDSGGIQKEAALRHTPCRTVRAETEWTELLECGVNRLVGAEPAPLVQAALQAQWPTDGLPPSIYGDGRASHQIADTIRRYCEDS